MSCWAGDRVASCYARIDIKTQKWIWGCTRPTSKNLTRLIMRLVGKSVADTTSEDLLDSD